MGFLHSDSLISYFKSFKGMHTF